MKNILLMSLLGLIGCQSPIQYRDDLTFASSGEANSPEGVVFINKKLCQDMEGTPGFCTLRAKEDILITLYPRDYTTQFVFRCGGENGIFFELDRPILPKVEVEFKIPHDAFKNIRVFNCIGRFAPRDRNEPIRFFFEVRVRVVDEDYTYLQTPIIVTYRGKKYFVSGEFGYKTILKDSKNKLKYENKTLIPIKDIPEFGVVESNHARFSFFFKGKASHE